MKALTFQLYSPLASWGEVAMGNTRPSDNHPTKSAVMGMICGSLGITRKELPDGVSQNYGFGVHVISHGRPLVDWHTAQVMKTQSKVTYHTRKDELTLVAARSKEPLGTITSRRSYYMEALYVVALLERENAPYSLEQIQAALEQPRFMPYLGRKSNSPGLPFMPRILEAENLRQAFDSCGLPDLIELEPNGSAYYWDEDIEAGMDSVHVVERRDEIVSRERWQFTTRRECYATI